MPYEPESDQPFVTRSQLPTRTALFYTAPGTLISLYGKQTGFILTSRNSSCRLTHASGAMYLQATYCGAPEQLDYVLLSYPYGGIGRSMHTC